MQAIQRLASAAALAALVSLAPSLAPADEPKTAIFAGGCFWCVESDFDHLPGVLDTTSGYTGGTLPNPTYENHEGHVEAVRVTYDPAKVSYDTLLKVFWHSVDPTDAGGQFCDRGHAYTTAIFANDDAELKEAERSKADVAKSLGQPVATAIERAGPFTEAEGYHQDYYKKNPIKYQYYRYGCGRNERVKAVWGDDAYLGIKDAMS
ncbi:peptide-methionine (S)-S-oxide reductase MsrA [Antarcticirhabdus aurantiaca]|uniref:Peptide-methionine (S)-S-oxide reductase MsrA n=1 Tax=Antarcticirhabdus aurantiaca TaxID=2606717 RepID=A0ACD4NJD5_9HYPH|nr:peptide-methionine (S)-S-oxide reductase MsrA [Antarcticirhabdus aurantiaca]WAJ26949.1 peptide-methionine (S)-S-oxide reductase MsrA [Jeongeuplla avenae]